MNIKIAITKTEKKYSDGKIINYTYNIFRIFQSKNVYLIFSNLFLKN